MYVGCSKCYKVLTDGMRVGVVILRVGYGFMEILGLLLLIYWNPVVILLPKFSTLAGYFLLGSEGSA